MALREVDYATMTTYAYPLRDLIANLLDSEDSNKNEVEELNGQPVQYILHFSSPPPTWELLCGRAGIYTVDAKTLKAESFELTTMN